MANITQKNKISKNSLQIQKLLADDPPVTARNLVLSLLASSPGRREAETSAGLIHVGELFDIAPQAMRMALTRLTQDNLIHSPSRGTYKIGSKGTPLRNKIRGWRHVSQKMKPWAGDWLMICTSHLGRTDRKQLRIRTRALRMNGFAEAQTGLWVRPANLIASLSEIQADFIDIGFDDTAIFLKVDAYETGENIDFTTLWDASKLIETYQTGLDAMTASRNGISNLSVAEAAKETFLVGQAIIKIINLDPLLPEEMTNTALLSTLIREMESYDELGKSFWREYRAGS